MDGWPRIPNQQSSSSPARAGASLPAPGTVVMASVEEDLGEGMYALRWSGQRIAVSSRAILKPGQSLILKSEISSEGKPTLVVQGPALPDPGKIIGRVVYGPGQHGGKTQQAGQQSVESRENRQGTAADGMRQGQDGQAVGCQVAAGVSAANIFSTARPVQSLIGLVLEPLTEFTASVEVLMKAVHEEKERLEGKAEEKTEEEGEKGPEAAEDGDAAEASRREKNSRPSPTRQDGVSDAAQTARAGPAAGQGMPRAADVSSSVISVEGGRSEAAPLPAKTSAASPPPVPEDTAPRSEGGLSSPQSKVSSSVDARDGSAARAPEARPSEQTVPNTPSSSGQRPDAASHVSSDHATNQQTGQAAAQTVAAETRPAGPIIPEVLMPQHATPSLPAAQPQSMAEASTSANPQIQQTFPPPQNAAASVSLIASDVGPAVPEIPVTQPSAGVSAPPAAPPPTQTVAQAVTFEAVADAQREGTQLPSASSPAAAEATATTESLPRVVGDASMAVPLPESSGGQGGPPPETLSARHIANAAVNIPAEGGSQGSIPLDVSRPAVDVSATREVSLPPDRALEGQVPPEKPLPADTGASVVQQDAQAQLRPDIKLEVFLKEALTQMVKASELPLGSASADGQSLGVGGKMPDAIVDKAAGILLQAAGLTPEGAALEAGRALVSNNVQVDRDTVQALITMVAGMEGDEREAMLKAAARLSAKDVPLSDPLVAGMADVMTRKAGAHELMTNAAEALAADVDIPEARPLMQGARELLELLHVDLDRADAVEALERYVSTFGREALGRALALVERSAQAVLENNPLLQNIDQALTAILTQLETTMAQFQNEGQSGQTVVFPGAAPLPAEGAAQEDVPAETPPPPRPSPAAMSPINAYLKAPKAVSIDELLGKLPPMPKLARLDQPVPQAPVTLPAPAAGVPQQIIPPQTGQTAQTLPGNMPQTAAPQQEMAGEENARSAPNPAPETPRGEASVLNRLDSLFQIPGLNRPELELLKPSGFLERFLNSGADGADGGRIKSEASALLRQLTADNPEHVQRALQEVTRKEPAVLRETAARLTRMEAETVRSEPLLNRLSDAATSLRDLGRQLIAVKAENLAGQDRNPGVMLAEIPFKLNDDAGNGRMQMFYRRSKKKGDSWTSRVILDLNTTKMGPVLGDMRFFGNDMIVNMFVETPETASYLEKSAEDLIAGLSDKGFRVKTRFMVMPPPPAPVEIRAERPDIAGEEPAREGAESPAEKSSSGGTSVCGRLDIQG